MILILLALVPNVAIGHAEQKVVSSAEKRRQAAPSRRKASSNKSDGSEWWKSSLILSMALWVFSIIFCKTIVEYQYNVLLASSVSPTAMIGITGYL